MFDSKEHLIIVQARRVLSEWETEIVAEMTAERACQHCAALMEQEEVFETRFYKFGHGEGAVYIPQWPE